MATGTNEIYEFEGFRLDAQNPGLWRGVEFLHVSPKALEMLILLVREKGGIVSREDLLETVWKDTFVEEGNINYTISLLRKALGAKDLIQTVPRRGYRFTGEMTNGISVAVAQPVGTVPARRSASPWLVAVGVLVGVLALTSFAAWYRTNSDVSARERAINSIAILSFKPLDANEADNLAAFGLTETLISRLGSLNRFAVRPFEAAPKPGREGEDAVAYGNRSKVDAVLDGTLERVEDRIRVNVRLLDVSDGLQLWTGRFDESEADLFKLQDKLADSIARSLTNDLTDRDLHRIAKRPTDNTEAYRAYLRGRIIFEQRDPNTSARAMDEFQRAVTLDPTFALAYTGLSDAQSRIGVSTTGPEADDAYTKSRFYAQKALTLDDELAEAYVSLGRVKRLHDRDWNGAERDLRTAIEINPNLAAAHSLLAQNLSSVARHDEALSEIKTAIQIDPISPTNQGVQFAILEGCGKWDEGLRTAEKLTRADHDNLLFQRALATFLFHKDQFERVIEVATEGMAKEERQKFVWLSLLSSAYAKTGQDAAARAALTALEELAKSDTKALYSLAQVYAESGRTDEAVAALRKCEDQKEERIAWMNVEPRFRSLRTNSGFHALVKSISLE